MLTPLNPVLRPMKISKITGQPKPVIRVYTTKRGDPMFFRADVCSLVIYYMGSPYFAWARMDSLPNWPTLLKFFARVTGHTVVYNEMLKKVCYYGR